MESKEKETSKTINKKKLGVTKKELMEKEFKKYLEEKLKHPTDFALSLIEAWRKKISLPFNLSERLKNKSKPFPSREEKEKFVKAMVEFFVEEFKLQELRELLGEKRLEQIKLPTFFPVPVKLDRKLRPLFLRRVRGKDFEKVMETESGNILEVFKKDQWSREIYYYILKGQLESLTYVKTPSLSNLAYPCFISTLGFAVKQGTLSPSYTKTDKLKSLGYTGKEGGKILKLIEDTEKLLKFLTYDIVDKRKGRRYKENLGSLYSYLEIREQGRNVIFNPTLDPKTLGQDLPKLVNGQFKGISWIDYLSIIKDRDSNPQQKRLFGYLEGLKGHKTTKPKTAKHLLSNIIGISPTYFKERPTYCHKVLIDEGLEVAKAKPYLSFSDYKVDYKSCPLDTRKWSFRFTYENKKDKKQEILPKNLVDKIVEWNCREVFGVKLKPERIKGMVKNTITAYGEEVIRSIFEKEINRYSPHPKNFWAEIKKLKAEKLILKLTKGG